MDVGVENVVKTLYELGVSVKIPEYPSILLALEMAPIDVQQMYQTLAAEGSYSPLKAIRSVMNLQGEASHAIR